MAVTIPKMTESVADVKKEAKKKENDLKNWFLKTQDKELTFVKVEKYNSDENKEFQLKRLLKRKEKEGYIKVTDLDLIEKIWGLNIASKMDAFMNGSGYFMIWKYSARLKVNDSEDEREKLFEELTPANEAVIMNYLKNDVNLYPNNYFLNIAGKWEISRSWQLVMYSQDNRVIMIRNENLVYPKRRDVHITDLPLISIKKAMKELGIAKEEKKTKK